MDMFTALQRHSTGEALYQCQIMTNDIGGKSQGCGMLSQLQHLGNYTDKKLARSRFKCWTPAFILLDPYLQLITVHCTRAGFQALAFVGDRRLDESLDTLSTAEKHTISNCPPASNVYEEYGHSKKGLSMWRTTILAAPCKLEQWSLPTDGRGNHSEISGSIFWKALSQLQISNSIVLEKLIIRTIPPPIDFN
ncbi:uncharacterized protein LOC103307538 isoform X4 [Chrysemys picta bellii]|uniref:uncharacterized protein LOC103307538 isoform X4 n=1 Tax=Chrysemys picta bellii TaxID=8478 RepID=UPI000CE6318C|nr:coiled-coil domain-containing protein 182 isoform X1 [Chrysemys picta bellii]